MASKTPDALAVELDERLKVAYRRAGGIARLARAPEGAEKIRKIAALEAVAFLTALRTPHTGEREGIEPRDIPPLLSVLSDIADDHDAKGDHWKANRVREGADYLRALSKPVTTSPEVPCASDCRECGGNGKLGGDPDAVWACRAGTTAKVTDDGR